MAVRAYVGLVSLMNLVEQVQRYAIRHSLPISIDNTFSSLHKTVTYLIDFLESGSGLEIFEAMDYVFMKNQIAESAYAALDIIDNHMLEYAAAVATTMLSFPGIQKVMKEMKSIENKVNRFRSRISVKDKKQLQQVTTPSPSYYKSFRMVGREEELVRLKNQLTRPNRSYDYRENLPYWYTNHQVILITGMGGIGKTTLAKYVYQDPDILHHFDIHVWISMNLECSYRQILLQALFSLENCGGVKEFHRFTKENSQTEDKYLGKLLRKQLFGRRYLIIFDGLWSTGALDMLLPFLPVYETGSSIIVTTRLSSVATHADSYTYAMDFLDENDSWDLFCREVFGLKDCPLELEEVGRKIVKICKGLPLAIVAIARVLLGSPRTREHWDIVARETNSQLNADDQKHCMDIIALSYHNLPLHLKPCFLYMGVFPKDNEVHTASLIDLWVGEGLLKPNNSKHLEEVGEEYLNDLVDRNVIFVHKRGSDGKPKSCNIIHPLLRYICLREAYKEKFFYVANVDIPEKLEDMAGHYRISLHQGSSKGERLLKGLKTMKLGSQARTLICDLNGGFPLEKFRLLKVFKVADKYKHAGGGTEHKYMIDDVFQLFNSRYIAFRAVCNSAFPSSLSLLWNLQILIVDEVCFVAPSEIWEMTELRHLEFRSGLYLPDPPSKKMDMQDDVVMTNLRILTRVDSFRCSDEVLKRIPNIKKLNISYENVTGGLNNYYLQNLRLLEKLESLSCNLYATQFEPRNWTKPILAFPYSLKKLTLVGCEFGPEDMMDVDYLPHLEVLKLKASSFRGLAWRPVGRSFNSLRFLLIDHCDLVDWDADGTHFPCLEHLVLRSLHRLQVIPPGIGEIAGLQSIRLDHCSISAVFSAKAILEEQQEFGNDDLHVQVKIEKKHGFESLQSPNFHIQYAQDEDESTSAGEIHVVEHKMSIESISPVKQQKDAQDEGEYASTGEIHEVESEMTTENLSSVQSGSPDESVTITISATGDLEYVDLDLKIFHASLQQMQHHVIDLVKGVLPPECLIFKGVSGSTKLPTEKEWEQACVICLTEMDHLVSLPMKPYCPNLVIIFLQSESHLFHIPPSFFDLMPELRFVDLSGIRSRALPNSLFNCIQLQVLLLRNCIYLDNFPIEIEKLSSIEVLDLSGAELYNLPEQVGKLKCLKDLQLSLYGPDDESEYVHLPPLLESKNILSELQAMQALSISVHPKDHRWKKIAGDITQEIAKLKNLKHLEFYFPEIKIFHDFIHSIPSLDIGLKTFKFVVGHDVKRIAPRVQDGVELKYHQLGRCLRFVNGKDDILSVIEDVLVHTEAFCLDHHFDVLSLSQFGISNLRNLKFCMVRECSSVKAIIDDKEVDEAVLPSVEFLGIYYLWKLQDIWNPSAHMPMAMGSLSFRVLKHLEVYTCRELKYIFHVSMLSYFSNLEELVVEDCEALVTITEGEMETPKLMFPRLRKAELRYLPELVGIGPGLRLTQEKMSVYGCPKLQLSVNPWKSLRGCCCFRGQN